jgi:hypothetical protein
MRHVWNAEGFVAFDGSVDDIDGVAAQHQVDERSAGALPALDFVLAHRVDEIVLLVRIELREPAAAVERLARLVDCADRCAIEIGIGRAYVEDAGFEQRFPWWNRELLIDEVGDACCARAGNERLAQCLDGLRLAGLEQAERHVLRPGFARGQEYLDAADRERECAGRRALHEVTSLDWVHRFLSMRHLRGISLTVTVIRASGF